MRILITNESRSAAGGIETYLKTLAPFLIEKGHEVGWLFGHSPSFGPLICNEDAKKVWTTNPATLETVRAEIYEWQPNVIYANGLHDPHWDTWLAKRYPTAYFAHGYFGTCISGRKCHGAAGYEICSRKLGPVCLLHYFPKRCGGRSPIRMVKDYRRERHRQRNLQNFSAVLVASNYMIKEYERHGVASDRLHIAPLFPTGILPDPAPPVKRSIWTNRVLMVGRLTELKGTSIACEAVSLAAKILARTLTFVVTGDAPGRERLEREASLHLVPVEMLGWTSSERRNVEMRNADALLVPSLWPEPFGLVGVEAGCVGLPAVAFDVGGIGDWLKSGRSGELVTTARPNATLLGEALAKSLSNSDYHQQLRLGAWAVSCQFQIDHHVDQLISIFAGVSNNK